MVVNETHTFKGSFLMYAIILLELPTLVIIMVLWQKGALGDEGPLVVSLIFGAMILLFSFLMSIQLEFRMDSNGFSYRNPPFINQWRKIEKDGIVNLKVKKTDGIFEYGGIGIRWSRKRTAYIFPANHVIEVQLPKRTLVFSTNRAQDVEKVIQNWAADKNIE